MTHKQLIYKWVTKNYISFEELEKVKDSSKIVGNKIYYSNEKPLEFRRLKDSIEIVFTYYDTIFSMSDEEAAKKINGRIVLNSKDSIFWKVKILSYDKNRLTLKSLYSLEDLRKIDSLSKVKVQKIDSTRNIIQLTRKEFKNMLKLNNFGYDHNFRKIN